MVCFFLLFYLYISVGKLFNGSLFVKNGAPNEYGTAFFGWFDDDIIPIFKILMSRQRLENLSILLKFNFECLHGKSAYSKCHERKNIYYQPLLIRTHINFVFKIGSTSIC